VTGRPSELARLAEEAAAIADRMHADHERLIEILFCELDRDELRELSDEWYVDTDAIVIEDGDDLSVYTTLDEWAIGEGNGGDGGEHWLAPPRRPLRIEDVLEEPPAA
jgi:hypothetical protein